MQNERIVSSKRFLAKREARLRRLQQVFGAVNPPETHRRIWGQNLDRLDAYLQRRNSPMDALKITAPENEPLIIMTRTLNAPRKLVWKAWTDPVHVAQWWGPRGVTTKIVELDLTPGGRWRFEHRMPDGSSYAFIGTYLEVVEPERLVNTFGMEGMYEDKQLVETHTFEEENGRTHYKSVSRFDTVEDRNGMLASGMEAGARESMDRLEELLATL